MKHRAAHEPAADLSRNPWKYASTQSNPFSLQRKKWGAQRLPASNASINPAYPCLAETHSSPDLPERQQMSTRNCGHRHQHSHDHIHAAHHSRITIKHAHAPFLKILYFLYLWLRWYRLFPAMSIRTSSILQSPSSSLKHNRFAIGNSSLCPASSTAAYACSGAEAQEDYLTHFLHRSFYAVRFRASQYCRLLGIGGSPPSAKHMRRLFCLIKTAYHHVSTSGFGPLDDLSPFVSNATESMMVLQ